jgi:hypothetical protein
MNNRKIKITIQISEDDYNALDDYVSSMYLQWFKYAEAEDLAALLLEEAILEKIETRGDQFPYVFGKNVYEETRG